MRTADAKQVFNKLTITNGFFYSPLFVYLKEMKRHMSFNTGEIRFSSLYAGIMMVNLLRYKSRICFSSFESVKSVC